MSELKKCPCGTTPDDLIISEMHAYRDYSICGNCCGEWVIEMRIYGRETKEEIKLKAIQRWNDIIRCF